MSRWFHVWWLLIIALIVGAIIVLYGLFNTSQQLNANTLYDAVYESAQYARDDSARESRGTFVINRKVFEERLSSYNIKGIGAISKNGENGSNGNKHNVLYIHYYLDNDDSEYKSNKDSNGVENEQLNSQRYNDNLKSSDKNTYISIRAIQVQALTNSQQHNWKEKNAAGQTITHYKPSNKKVIDESHNQKEQAPSSITNVNNKYVATLVVQSQDALKKSKYIQNTNDFKSKQNQQDKATTNNPIRNPNSTKRDYEDLTIPSYSETKDNSGENNTNDTLNTHLKS